MKFLTADWHRKLIAALPASLASLAVLLAVLAIMGWLLDISTLRSFGPSLSAMKPSTAILISMIAIALLLNQSNKHYGYRKAAVILAAIVAMVSVVHLVNKLHSATARLYAWTSPSDATSLALLLLALMVMLLQMKQPYSRLIAILFILAVLLPLHRLISFLIGPHTFKTSGFFDSMSLPTGLALSFLAISIFLHPRLPYAGQLAANDLQGRLLRAILPWTLVVPTFLAVLFITTISYEQYHTEIVMVAMVAILTVMITALLWELTKRLQLADIDRQLAETTLLDSEVRANQIFESSPDAMLVVDEIGRIERINARMEEMFGYRRNELLGEQMEILIPERFRGTHGDALNRYLLSPQARFMGEGRDLFAKRKDGSEFAVEIGLAPLETPTGVHVLANIVDITTRLRTQAAIEAALQEKTLLLNEVHHRVKNNLQIVASLLNLQSGRVGNPTFSALIAESEGRVRAMALMHQILYERKDFARVDLDIYLRRLGELLGQIHGASPRGIMIHIDSAPITLDLIRAIPLGLIVNELLSNIFKHAFPTGGGDVWLELQAVNDSDAMLQVYDNGCGLPVEFAWETSNSLGMQIVRLLAEQIGASLSVESNNGTCFVLCFTPFITDTEAALAYG